jgi:hypothetical protein
MRTVNISQDVATLLDVPAGDHEATADLLDFVSRNAASAKGAAAKALKALAADLEAATSPELPAPDAEAVQPEPEAEPLPGDVSGDPDALVLPELAGDVVELDGNTYASELVKASEIETGDLIGVRGSDGAVLAVVMVNRTTLGRGTAYIEGIFVAGRRAGTVADQMAGDTAVVRLSLIGGQAPELPVEVPAEDPTAKTPPSELIAATEAVATDPATGV